MNDFTALNEAYNSMASDRMSLKQDIGTLIIHRDHEIYLRRNRGTIRIEQAQIINLPGRRSLQFILDHENILIRFEDSSGDLISAEVIKFPTENISKTVTLKLYNDLDGPTLILR